MANYFTIIGIVGLFFSAGSTFFAVSCNIFSVSPCTGGTKPPELYNFLHTSNHDESHLLIRDYISTYAVVHL